MKVIRQRNEVYGNIMKGVGISGSTRQAKGQISVGYGGVCDLAVGQDLASGNTMKITDLYRYFIMLPERVLVGERVSSWATGNVQNFELP